MNVLITGGAGFIGTHTAVALSEAGYRPVIIDNFSNSEEKALEGLRQILGDMPSFYREDCCDPDVLRHIFKNEKIGGVIHFAAFKAVGESQEQPLKYYKNNLLSLISLLEIMREFEVSNLIFSSSCTVYGTPEQLPVTESAPFQTADSVYGNTKQICEEILRDCTSAGDPFKVVSLRYFNPVGAHPSGRIGELPRGVPNNLVPYITQTAAGLRPFLRIFGGDYPTPDGTCIRDYIHVMDLAEAHVAALQYLTEAPEATVYEAFNVGTGQGASVLEVVQTFEKVNGVKVDYQIVDRRPGDIMAVYADANRAAEGLRWRAKRSLESAMEDAWRWQKNL